MSTPNALRVIHSSAWFENEKLITISAGARIYDPVEIEMLIARDPFFGTEKASYEAIDPAPVSRGEWYTAHSRDLDLVLDSLRGLEMSLIDGWTRVEDDAALAALVEKFDAKARETLDRNMARIRTGLAARGKATA